MLSFSRIAVYDENLKGGVGTTTTREGEKEAGIQGKEAGIKETDL